MTELHVLRVFLGPGGGGGNPLGVFLDDRWNRYHLAVILLTAQPSQKGTLQQVGVEPVRFGTTVLARNGYA